MRPSGGAVGFGAIAAARLERRVKFFDSRFQIAMLTTADRKSTTAPRTRAAGGTASGRAGAGCGGSSSRPLPAASRRTVRRALWRGRGSSSLSRAAPASGRTPAAMAVARIVASSSIFRRSAAARTYSSHSSSLSSSASAAQALEELLIRRRLPRLEPQLARVGELARSRRGERRIARSRWRRRCAAGTRAAARCGRSARSCFRSCGPRRRTWPAAPARLDLRIEPAVELREDRVHARLEPRHDVVLHVRLRARGIELLLATGGSARSRRPAPGWCRRSSARWPRRARISLSASSIRRCSSVPYRRWKRFLAATFSSMMAISTSGSK